MASIASSVGISGFSFGQTSPVALNRSNKGPARVGMIICTRRLVAVRAEGGGNGINPDVRKTEAKVVDSVVITELEKPLTAYCRAAPIGNTPKLAGHYRDIHELGQPPHVLVVRLPYFENWTIPRQPTQTSTSPSQQGKQYDVRHVSCAGDLGHSLSVTEAMSSTTKLLGIMSGLFY